MRLLSILSIKKIYFFIILGLFHVIIHQNLHQKGGKIIFYHNKMAKKISRANKNKKRVVGRSSILQKTIDEGTDYVNRATRVLNLIKARRVQPQASTSPQRKTKPVKKVKKAKQARPIRPAVPSRPAVLPTSVPIPAAVVRTASRTISRSGSKNVIASGNNQIIIEQELQDRLGKHNANIGKLNFSLRWWDPNDLDLHVTCPCNTEICFLNKKCTKCGGQLDIDMNVGMNMSNEPVQHIFFNKPKPGLYKFFVRYFSGPKQHMGVKGGEKSKYALSLHEDINQIFRYEDTVSNTNRDIHYDFNR